MPPKMFTRIAVTLGSSRMSRIAALTLSARAPPPMSRKLAGSPPARLTRSIVVIARPAPLTMQPIVPSSLMKLMPSARARGVGRVLLVEVAEVLEPGMAGQGRVVQGDLGVEALEAEALGPVRGLRPDDRERIDLDEVRVVREHRPDEALGDRDGRLEVGAEAERERHLAGLPVEQPEVGMGVDPDDRLGPFRGDLLDLHAALGRAHEQDPPGAAVEHGAEVELADDVGRGSDEDLADRDALDVHARGCVRRRLRPRRRPWRASRRRPCPVRRRAPGP